MNLKSEAIIFYVYSTYHKYEIDEEYVRKEIYGSQKVVDVLNFMVVKVTNSSAE